MLATKQTKNTRTLPGEAVDLGGMQWVLVLVAVFGFFTANPLESAFAVGVLYFLLKKFWRANVPPVVPLLFLMPWLEISTPVYEANIRSESLNEMLHGTGQYVYWLSILGLVAVMTGFSYQFKRTPLPSMDELTQLASKYSPVKLMAWYFALGPIAGFAGRALRGSSFYQLVTYLDQVSSVVLILICLQQALTRERHRLFIPFILVGIGLSFYSLFSSWKIFAFAFFIAYGTTQYLNRRLIIRIVVLAVFFGNLIFLWQGVKGDYRAFITDSEGRGALVSQRVVVEREAALAKFFELAGDFYSSDEDNVEDSGLEDNELLFSTLRRAGYLEFFSLTALKVPEITPHERGNLLKESLSFALIPRFLNPNKGIKDDGAKVEKYTNFMVSDTASFSLGHYVEYFIDFGPIGMVLYLFFFGLAGASVYRFLLIRNVSDLNGLVLLPVVYVVLSSWGSFQNDAVVVFGYTFFGFICHGWIFKPVYRHLERTTATKGNA